MPGTGTGCLPGLYLISTFALAIVIIIGGTGCQCPLGLELLRQRRALRYLYDCFNALSGLYLISTWWHFKELSKRYKFQCPLGLIPHFYMETSLVTEPVEMSFNALSGLYLISTVYYRDGYYVVGCFNALSGLYLISTVPLQKPRFYAVSRACFCRYLSEYSDNSRFSCMLTFWTYLMRCTYPWHWIKYSTNYNRCHPIFSLSW